MDAAAHHIKGGRKTKLGVQGVLLANILSSASLLVLTLPIIIKRFRFQYLNSKILGEILRFGLPFFPAGIFTVIMELTDRLLLEWLTDTATVGIYSAGHKLGMFGSLLVTGFNMGWMPYFLRRGKEPGAQQDFSRITTIFLGSLWCRLLGFYKDRPPHSNELLFFRILCTANAGYLFEGKNRLGTVFPAYWRQPDGSIVF
jgi:hypothetical protein